MNLLHLDYIHGPRPVTQGPYLSCIQTFCTGTMHLLNLSEETYFRSWNFSGRRVSDLFSVSGSLPHSFEVRVGPKPPWGTLYREYSLECEGYLYPSLKYFERTLSLVFSPVVTLSTRFWLL